MEINAHEHDAKSYAEHLNKIGRRYIHGSQNGTEKERMTLNEQIIMTGLLIKQKHTALGRGCLPDYVEFDAGLTADCFIKMEFSPLINQIISNTLNVYKDDIIAILNTFPTETAA